MNPIEKLLPENDALFQSLQNMAEELAPEAHFKYELEENLRAAHKPRTGFYFSRRDILQFAGLTAALALLAIVLSFVIRSIVPPHVPAGVDKPTATPALATPTVVGNAPTYIVQEGDTCRKIASDFGVSVEELTAANNLSPLCTDMIIGMELVIPVNGIIIAPQADGYNFNGLKLFLNADLPSLPLEANIYTTQPDQHATVETARALAQRFGIEGQVYNSPGELPGTTDYVVTAGGSRLYVRSDNYFSYYSEYSGIHLGSRTLTDEQAAVAIADFMQSLGFDFEYTIEHAPQVYGAYYVVPLLDGQPLRYTYLMPARLELTLDDNGQVTQVFGALLNTEKVGTYGVRTAEEAFQQIVNGAERGIMQQMRSGGMVEMKLWMREYPENQPMTLYGQVRSLPAAEVGQPPFITLSDFTLTGNLTGLESIQEDMLVEADGQFVTQNGIRMFQVETWKVSSSEFMTITGTLHKEDTKTYLLDTSSNEYPYAANPVKYSITDLPTDVPFDTYPPAQLLTVDGIVNNDQIEWTVIQYMPVPSGGGGGGGGGSLYMLNLTGTPIPLPTPAPTLTAAEIDESNKLLGYSVREGDTLASIAQQTGISVDELMQANGFTDPTLYVGQMIVIPVGDSLLSKKVEGQRGILIVNVYGQTDGSQRVEYALTTSNPAYQYVKLQGENLDELYNYHGRPVDIWGTIDHLEDFGTPVVKVDRYEIPFPDLNFQILQGTQQTTTISGQTALLFTTEDGTTYIQMSNDCFILVGPDSLVGDGKVGELVQLEALLVPDLTYAGYPVACGFTSVPAIDPQSGQPTQLQVTSDQPYFMMDTPGRNSNTTIHMTIEKVELVYCVTDPRYTFNDPNKPAAYVQPMWRFYGHYSNGSEFEIMVQALKDEFLSPEVEDMAPPG